MMRRFTTNGISLLSQGLICALKYRDKNTLFHSERVTGLAINIGKQCGLSSLEIDTLMIAASLHDIGKIGIADNILLKPGKLVLSTYVLGSIKNNKIAINLNFGRN